MTMNRLGNWSTGSSACRKQTYNVPCLCSRWFWELCSLYITENPSIDLHPFIEFFYTALSIRYAILHCLW